MQNFILSTDSCSDVHIPRLKENGVECIALDYIHNGVSTPGVADSDAEFAQFYNFLRSGNMPTTTQLNIFELKEYFTRILSEKQSDIVHISLSSGLSGTFNNAVLAAKEAEEAFPGRKVYIVDSLGATVGQGILVDEGINLCQNGFAALEAYERLSWCGRHSNYIIMPNDLFHLRRGGRISAVSAIFGTVLQIKPLIHFDNAGKLVVIDKVKGMTKGIREMVKHTLRSAVDIEKQTVYIAHGDAFEAANELKDMLQSEVAVPVKIGYVGPVIGTHLGPGALGMVCLGGDREKFRK